MAREEELLESKRLSVNICPQLLIGAGAFDVGHKQCSPQPGCPVGLQL